MIIRNANAALFGMASLGPCLIRPPNPNVFSLSFVFGLGVTFYKVSVYAVRFFFFSLAPG